MLSIAVLIVGYLTYSRVVERFFRIDENKATPAVTQADGIDYVPMKPWRSFLIQLLNIAGLGPIFGALTGAIWGPCVYLWIVFGTIFAGGVHDFLGGMMSVRHKGSSISEVVGLYMGRVVKFIMRIFSVVLLVMIGVVFMVGPAGLLAKLTPNFANVTFWTIVILCYYFVATLLPIDKVIGKLYPFFGVCLVVMALAIGIKMLINQGTNPMPEISLENLHPEGQPIWPLMFVSVACGAVSGFHATQSPMIARCIENEKQGRSVFYGAMVAEGIIALIWAAAGVTFYHGTSGLLAAGGGSSSTVYDISMGMLGPIGGIFAMVGVIACPITSGDTAFRSARLTIADWFHIDQKNTKKRLILSALLLGIGFWISFADYQVVWRYFSWTNQTLAMMVLWTGAVFLLHANSKKKWRSLIAVIPAVFMTAVCSTYFLYSPEGFHLSSKIAYPIGIICAVISLAFYIRYYVKLDDEWDAIQH